MRIYNTLSRKKEEFIPIDPQSNVVRMYTCGITPYDSPHLGHTSTAIRSAIIRNYFQYRGYQVTSVQNITDVNDKITDRAKEHGVSPLELAKKYSDEYDEMRQDFGIAKPDSEPTVSGYMPKIIEYIEVLIDKGTAYATDYGDVYFDVTKIESYGCLSNRKLEENLEGTRESVREDKKHPLDFALWKRADEGEFSYDSPWGCGNPGWHIECSVMSTDILGQQFEIHLGGLDLLFPHHENELAQCTAHSGQQFVKYWAHLGLLNIDGSKMSKSLGNFLTSKEAIKKYGKELIHFAVSRFHYRSPINLSDSLFDELLNMLKLYYWILHCADKALENQTFDEEAAPSELVTEITKSFHSAMDNDINSALAWNTLEKGFKELLKLLEKENRDLPEIHQLEKCLRTLGGIFHLFSKDASYETVVNQLLSFRASVKNTTSMTVSEIEALYSKRQEARAQKSWEDADKIRDKVADLGITFNDNTSLMWRF